VNRDYPPGRALEPAETTASNRADRRKTWRATSAKRKLEQHNASLISLNDVEEIIFQRAGELREVGRETEADQVRMLVFILRDHLNQMRTSAVSSVDP